MKSEEGKDALMQDKPEPVKANLLPCSLWLMWLGVFLTFSPIALVMNLLFPSASSKSPANSPLFYFLGLPFSMALAITLLFYFGRYRVGDAKHAEMQEQTRLAALKAPPPRLSMYHWYGMISAIFGGMACIARLSSGYPSVLIVVLLTIGAPVYAFLAVRLLKALGKWEERRLQRRVKVRRKVSASVALGGDAQPSVVDAERWKVSEEGRSQTIIRQ